MKLTLWFVFNGRNWTLTPNFAAADAARGVARRAADVGVGRRRRRAARQRRRRRRRHLRRRRPARRPQPAEQRRPQVRPVRHALTEMLPSFFFGLCARLWNCYHFLSCRISCVRHAPFQVLPGLVHRSCNGLCAFVNGSFF